MEADVGVYEPLGQFLGHLTGDYWRPTFHELERLLGRDLPTTARRRRSWWAEDGGAHAKAWLDAGWRAADVNFDKETVTFRRGPGDLAEPTPDGGETAGLGQRALRIAKDRPLMTAGAAAAGAFAAGLVLGLVIGDEI
jgi:hypothetical protein